MTAAGATYARLLSEIQPAVVHDEEQSQRYTERLENLAFKKNQTAAERKLIELLTLLIENFEEEAYEFRGASPIEVILELMEAHDLKQKDLVEASIFESASVASEVVNGKRELTKEHIKRLSKHFHVSPLAFFDLEG